MRYLLIVDLALAALGAAMTVSVGFVALVYLIYGHTSAHMAAALPGVSIMTGCFLLLCLFALLAGVLLRKRLSFHWAAQLLLFGSLPLLWHTILFHLQA